MSFLLDTCVISELIKPQPNPHVLSWFSKQEENDLFLSVLTLGEIEKGIAKIKIKNKAKKLTHWLHNDLICRFEGRILEINLATCQFWGKISSEQEMKGYPLPVIDALLIATAKANGLVYVTRDATHLEKIDHIDYCNPWNSVSNEIFKK